MLSEHTHKHTHTIHTHTHTHSICIPLTDFVDGLCVATICRSWRGSHGLDHCVPERKPAPRGRDYAWSIIFLVPLEGRSIFPSVDFKDVHIFMSVDHVLGPYVGVIVP